MPGLMSRTFAAAFDDRYTTNVQITLFGLTGCPSSLQPRSRYCQFA